MYKHLSRSLPKSKSSLPSLPFVLTDRGLQLSRTYFPAELLSSQRSRPPLKYFVFVRRTILKGGKEGNGKCHMSYGCRPRMNNPFARNMHARLIQEISLQGALFHLILGAILQVLCQICQNPVWGQQEETSSIKVSGRRPDGTP